MSSCQGDSIRVEAFAAEQLVPVRSRRARPDRAAIPGDADGLGLPVGVGDGGRRTEQVGQPRSEEEQADSASTASIAPEHREQDALQRRDPGWRSRRTVRPDRREPHRGPTPPLPADEGVLATDRRPRCTRGTGSRRTAHRSPRPGRRQARLRSGSHPRRAAPRSTGLRRKHRRVTGCANASPGGPARGRGHPSSESALVPRTRVHPRSPGRRRGGPSSRTASPTRGAGPRHSAHPPVTDRAAEAPGREKRDGGSGGVARAGGAGALGGVGGPAGSGRAAPRGRPAASAGRHGRRPRRAGPTRADRRAGPARAGRPTGSGGPRRAECERAEPACWAQEGSAREVWAREAWAQPAVRLRPV